MAGANYMGGRRSVPLLASVHSLLDELCSLRNAARAKVKDSDARLHRSHFGKQRLAVLTKGLRRSDASTIARRLSRGEPVAVPHISFAHARRVSELPNVSYRDSVSTSGRAYSQANAPDLATRKQRANRIPSNVRTANRSSPGTRSSTSHSSKILRELDISERQYRQYLVRTFGAHLL